MSLLAPLLRVARKLRGRSATELRDRAAQAGAIWMERAGLLDARELDASRLGRLLRGDLAGADAEAWRAHLRTREGTAGAPRFFPSFDDRAATIEAIRLADPTYIDAVLRRAERFESGKFDLLGYTALDFGTPIDWHLDPVAGVRAPLAHWSRIPYLDPRVAGDHKVVWELNRHQWLVTLAEAYWLTGDERWARVVVDRLTDWMDANPPKRGVNWASSLEVGFRAISWCWIIALLRDGAALTPAVLARMMGFLALHARHLDRNLSTYFSPNTHLTGEALALFHVGSMLSELREAARWRERGWGILIDQLPIHARPDGVYFEQAVYYHKYTVDFYVHLLVLAERNGIEDARARIAPHLERLIAHLMHLARPDGTVPLIGDEDGGRLAWLDHRRSDDVRSAIAAGAVLFARPDFAFAAGEPTAELVWLLGPDAPARLAALERRAPDATSRAFPDGGVFVMRDGWGPSANQMVIDCGPHGIMNCGHAHADALAFEVSAAGRPVLVDPGTYVYTADPALRDWFRSTEAHNALTVDGESSSVSNGPFQWRHIARCETRAWHAFAAADWFEGSHDGFERLAAPARYRRGVLFVKADGGPLYWVVRDHLESSREHDVAITFQCDTDVSVGSVEADAAELSAHDASVMRLTFAAQGSGESPRITVDERWVSRRYGHREAAPRLRLSLRSADTTVVVSVLAPAIAGADPDARFPAVRRLEVSRGIALEIAAGVHRDVLLFEAAGAEPVDGIETDAQVAWVRRDTQGSPTVALLIGGTRLAMSGTAELVGRGAACARLVSGRWLVEGVGARLELAGPSRAGRSSLVTRS